MIHKTKGIVLRFTRFRETSIIVNIFTEVFGLQSYIVNNVRIGSIKSEMALFQPLTLLELVVYHKEHGQVTRIKEKACAYAYRDLTTNPVKAAIALFLNEILVKVLRDESQPKPMYDFLEDAFIVLDRAQDHVENFHLVFLLQLCGQLGFGAYQPETLLGGRYTSAGERVLVESLLRAGWESDLRITNSQRRWLLDVLLKFCQDHIHHLGTVKSVDILRDVLG